MENPSKPTGPLAELVVGVSIFGVALLYDTIVLSLLSLIYRNRQSDALVRQQLKWLVSKKQPGGDLDPPS